MEKQTVDRVTTVFGSIAKKYPTFRDDDVVKAPKRLLNRQIKSNKFSHF